MNYPYAIRAENLVKQFDKFTAIDGLSLEIRPSEIFGFLGPNGAGKTTSIRMICGLLKPTSGSISFGTPLSIGLCPQENIHWDKLTLLEQLVFMGSMYGMTQTLAKNRSIMLLDKMGLSAKKNKLAETLSGGMKRRLNICLTLVHDPQIIVLDEPEAGLDPQSRVLVRDFIHEIAPGKTIILTTHNMDEAERLADRVAIIDKGKLLKLDTPANLKKTLGDGDILELSTVPDTDERLSLAAAILQSIIPNVKTAHRSIIVRSNDMINLIPAITNAMKKRNITIGELKMRSNTLEDVFIHLTGRMLRE